MEVVISPLIVSAKRKRMALADFSMGSKTYNLIDAVLLRSLIRSDLLTSMVGVSNPRDIFSSANPKLNRNAGLEIRAIRFPVDVSLDTMRGPITGAGKFHWGVFDTKDLEVMGEVLSIFTE